MASRSASLSWSTTVPAPAATSARPRPPSRSGRLHAGDELARTAAANRTLYRELGYDPDKDFEPISLFAHFPNLIVINSKLPISSLTELVAYAKARPKQLNYGSVGVGSSQHLSGLYFEQVTGVELTHVPYRNIAQYIPDLISGAVPLGFQWLPNVTAALKTGDAKPLAVTISKRMTAMPDVPTTAEAGIKNYETSGWLGLLAPRGTPKPIVTKLNQEIAAALADKAVRDRFVEQGGEAVGGTPEEFAKFISSETVKWRDIITKAGIPPIQCSSSDCRLRFRRTTTNHAH